MKGGKCGQRQAKTEKEIEKDDREINKNQFR